MIFKKNGIIVENNFISLDEIIKQCHSARIIEEDLCLLIIEWKSTRSFDGAKETLVVNKKDAKEFKKLLTGLHVNFGEIAGKHSEVYGDLLKEHITIETKEEEILKFLSTYPYGHEYNHSFLDTLNYELGDYNEDISETRKNSLTALFEKYL